jgi:tetratricopeptide (TPR) repeat protein
MPRVVAVLSKGGPIRLNSLVRSCRSHRLRVSKGPVGIRIEIEIEIGFVPMEGEGVRMGLRAVIAGCYLGFGLLPGCATVQHRREKQAEASPQSTSREDLSQAATLAMDKGDYHQARIDLERLLAQAPRSPELHFRLGKVLQCLEHLDEAAAEYKTALRFDPLYVGALVGMGQIDARLARPAQALKQFEKAIDVAPHQAEAHFARGQTLEVLGRPDDALAAYFRSLEFGSPSALTILRIATLQLKKGQPEQALVRLEQANELTPDDPEIRFRRGQTFLALNQPKPAIIDLAFAAEHLPERPDVLLNLAQALDADRQPLLARQALDKALRLQPDLPVARELSDRLRR